MTVSGDVMGELTGQYCSICHVEILIDLGMQKVTRIE